MLSLAIAGGSAYLAVKCFEADKNSQAGYLFAVNAVVPWGISAYIYGKEAITGENQKKEIISYNELKKEYNKKAEEFNRKLEILKRNSKEDYKSKATEYAKIDDMISELSNIKTYAKSSYLKNQANSFANELNELKNNGMNLSKIDFKEEVLSKEKYFNELKQSILSESNTVDEKEQDLEKLIYDYLAYPCESGSLKNSMISDLRNKFNTAVQTGNFEEFDSFFEEKKSKLSDFRTIQRINLQAIGGVENYLYKISEKLDEASFSYYEQRINELKEEQCKNISSKAEKIKKEISENVKMNELERYVANNELNTHYKKIIKNRVIDLDENKKSVEFEVTTFNEFGDFINRWYVIQIIKYDSQKEKWFYLKSTKTANPLVTQNDLAIEEMKKFWKKIIDIKKDINELEK